MWHIWETGEVHIGFWLGDLSERDHLEDPCIHKRIILKWVFREMGLKVVEEIVVAQDRDRWRGCCE
jgi:hypothetical protein